MAGKIAQGELSKVRWYLIRNLKQGGTRQATIYREEPVRLGYTQAKPQRESKLDTCVAKAEQMWARVVEIETVMVHGGFYWQQVWNTHLRLLNRAMTLSGYSVEHKLSGARKESG